MDCCSSSVVSPGTQTSFPLHFSALQGHCVLGLASDHGGCLPCHQACYLSTSHPERKIFSKRHSRRIPLLPLAQNWVTVSSSCQGAWRGESSAFPAPPVRGGSQEKAVGWVTNKQSPVPGLTPPLSCYLDRLLLPAS